MIKCINCDNTNLYHNNGVWWCGNSDCAVTWDQELQDRRVAMELLMQTSIELGEYQ